MSGRGETARERKRTTRAVLELKRTERVVAIGVDVVTLGPGTRVHLDLLGAVTRRERRVKEEKR
jgi:hypothetical protein